VGQQADYFPVSPIAAVIGGERNSKESCVLRYSVYNDVWETRLYTARRLLMLVPFVVFLATLMLFSGALANTPNAFAQLITRVTAVSMASSIVCVGAYGFYRYHLDKTYGL
jgi:hypothetical protein